jgi:hypothetical protein
VEVSRSSRKNRLSAAEFLSGSKLSRHEINPAKKKTRMTELTLRQPQTVFLPLSGLISFCSAALNGIGKTTNNGKKKGDRFKICRPS